jgi:hypothetical protein
LLKTYSTSFSPFFQAIIIYSFKYSFDSIKQYNKGIVHLPTTQQNWGRATPEFINQELYQAVLFFHHTIKDEKFLELNSLFIQSRVNAYAKQLPKGMSIRVIFDDTANNIYKKYQPQWHKQMNEQVEFEYFSVLKKG